MDMDMSSAYVQCVYVSVLTFFHTILMHVHVYVMRDSYSCNVHTLYICTAHSTTATVISASLHVNHYML